MSEGEKEYSDLLHELGELPKDSREANSTFEGGDESVAEDAPIMGQVTDSIRKILSSGLNSLMTTEESVRQTIGDLPKETLSYFMTQADKTRSEMLRIVADEFKEFLESVDLQKEIKTALRGMTVEVKAEITLRDNDEGGSQLKHSVTFGQAADTKEPKRKVGRARRKPRRKEKEQA